MSYCDLSMSYYVCPCDDNNAYMMEWSVSNRHCKLYGFGLLQKHRYLYKQIWD